MYRRPTQDARSNSIISTHSSLPSLVSTTTNDNPNTNLTTIMSDEEAQLSEKPPTKNPKLPIPSRKAGPEEIRSFFKELLTQHDVDGLEDDEAKCEEIVSAWKVGGGVEMRQYGPTMFLDMFGREYGWILYREVKMSVRKEVFWGVRRPLYSFIVASFLLEVLTITLLVHLDMDEGLSVVVILAAVVGMLTLLVSLVILCAGNSPARLIERDLRACTKALAKGARLG